MWIVNSALIAAVGPYRVPNDPGLNPRVLISLLQKGSSLTYIRIPTFATRIDLITKPVSSNYPFAFFSNTSAALFLPRTLPNLHLFSQAPVFSLQRLDFTILICNLLPQTCIFFTLVVRWRSKSSSGEWDQGRFLVHHCSINSPTFWWLTVKIPICRPRWRSLSVTLSLQY